MRIEKQYLIDGLMTDEKIALGLVIFIMAFLSSVVIYSRTFGG